MRNTSHFKTLLVVTLLFIAYPLAYAVPPPDAEPDGSWPLVVKVYDGPDLDNLDIVVRFADHTSDLYDGNWIVLGGGTSVTLPTVVMSYNGISEASIELDGIKVEVKTQGFDGKTVTYPLATHPVYYPGQEISYTYHGDPAFAGHEVDVRVIAVAVTEFRDAAIDAFEGDTSAMKDILSGWVYESTETLDGDGDLSGSIGTLPAGDYVMVIVDEDTGSPYALDVYSATAIEVLGYASTVTVPTSVTRGSYLSVDVGLTGADASDRVYGAAMIQQTEYSVDVALTCDGTLEGTELTFMGVPPERLDEAFSENVFSFASSDYTTATQQTVKIPTSGLNTGNYFVMVGVWEGSSKKLVAFYQAETSVNPPPAPPPVVALPTLPTVEQLMALSDLAAANLIAALTPAQGASLLVRLPTEKAAGIMENLQTGVAVAIVERMSVTDAATILGEVQTQTWVQVLANTEASHAVDILGETDPGKIADGLAEAVSRGYVPRFSEFMNQLDEGHAAEALLGTAPEAGARIVEGMAQDDLHEAAKRVEAAVKKRLAETDPEKAREIIDRIARTLEHVDTETLVAIFVEIASLPETPSTVATVLEAMDMTKVLDVVSTWMGIGSLEELAEVYGYFTDAFLEDVWMGMTSGERNTLYPYLDAATAGRLPEIGEFQVSGLQVSPATVTPGQVVTVSVSVENMGDDPAAYTLTLRIDGATEQTEKVSLTPGQSQTVQWTTSRTQAKTYVVDVNGLIGSFTVEAEVAPAAFTLSSLAVTPTTVEAGEPVTVSVSVANTGGERGSTEVELRVNNVVAETQTVTLDAGASTTAVFSVTRDEAGSYTVTIGSLTASFTVTAPPPPAPRFPWAAVVVAVVAVAAIGYYLYVQRKQ